MNVEKHNLQEGSCNFCSGEYSKESPNTLSYNYDHVFSIDNGTRMSLSARICENCVKELAEKVAKL